jgi:hypothetical protein
MRATKPKSKNTTETYQHTVQLASPRKLREEMGGDASETDSDAVFQGLQNRYRDLLQSTLTKISTALGRVTTLLFS